MLDIARSRTTYQDCPACGYKQSLSVTFKDGKPLYHCHAGCDPRELWRVVRGDAAAPAALTRPAPVPKDSTIVRSYAAKLWRDSLPAAESPILLRYLAGRGLVGLVPPALRFLPNHTHKPSGTNWPVMLAAVTDGAGNLQAVHRTYLAADGNGKAPVTPTKMTLAPVGGFAIHLAAAGETLAIAEGIETAFSVQLATGLPAWAAISCGNMRALVLPPLPMARTIILCADNDPPGLAAAHDSARRWEREGRTVRLATPPTGQDFNDLLREAAQ